MSKISGDAVRGHLETMILSALESGHAHGFEVLRRLREAGSGALELKEGSVYPALYRLEQAGLVQAKWDADDTARRGPRRRVYQLTSRGRRSLAERRQQWQQFVSVVGAIVGGMA